MERHDMINQLKDTARQLRADALTMIHKAQSGHPGGSLSAADLMAALYFYELKLDPQKPKWIERDRFVLSKGHVCPILYCALIRKGFMDRTTLYTLRQYKSQLQGHPDMKATPGVDISTGSLGQGISAAVGMAIGLKRDKLENRVFVMLGDGECDEGQVWESVACGYKYALDNLTIIVDHNKIQNDGPTDVIMPLRSLKEKFDAFGCISVEIDGHDMSAIIDALDYLRPLKGKPKCIIAHGIKGKGVSFMENVTAWHGAAPNDAQFKQALKEVMEG